MVEVSKLKKVHIVGIGGIGVSAVAQMLLLGNPEIGLSPCVVSGSDMSASPITEALLAKGAAVSVGHKAQNVPADADLVLYTIAIPQENPELKRARGLGIQMLTYPQMLGVISSGLYTIAISGTHGKTTTTAMFGKILIEAGLDPTVIVGSIMKDAGSNLVVGKSKYFVVEACEYRRSFLNLNPSLIGITNIDADHLDYYKDLDDIKSAFREFREKLPAGGRAISEAEYSAIALPIKLKVPGNHNQKNAQLAIALAKVVGVSEESARKSLETFSGTWRRIEHKGAIKKTGAVLYDDYAHAPDEVRATLSALKELYPGKKIWAAFRPHLYSRTKLLLKEFGTAFKDADEVLIADIYAAREPADPSIHAKDLVREIAKTNRSALYVPDYAGMRAKLELETGPNDVVVTMGAGDIYELAEALIS